MEHIHYSIDIEKNASVWVGMLNQIVNYNIPPLGFIKREKEIVATSYMELYQKMFEAGFFAKMETNTF